MPRSFLAESDRVLAAMTPLEETDHHTNEDETDDDDSGEWSEGSNVQEAQADEVQQVKTYVQALTLLDVESCVALEDSAFPPQERCSREKFTYRFTTCGELSLGLFTSANTDQAVDPEAGGQDVSSTVTVPTAQPVYSGTPDRKQVLLAHVIATKTTNATLTDDDMAMPEAGTRSTKGHKESGRTVCVHSLAVLPAFRYQGLGSLLMKSYIQRIESAGLADRMALIAHDQLINFYEKLGFKNQGKSQAQFGGGGWYDMVLELKSPTEDD